MATQNILAPGKAVYPGQSSVAQTRAIRFGDSPEDYAIYNSQSRRYESAKSGTPWTGAIRGTNSFAQNGVWTDKDPGGQQGDGLPQFQTIQTVKQPGVANATNNLLSTQQQGATTTGNIFKSFLDEAKQVNADAKTQLAKDQEAFNTAKIESQLPAVNATYRAGQEAVTADMAARNKAYAGQTQETIARLNAENQRYEAAARAVADRAAANNTARVNLMQLTSGTPTSGSGNLSSRYMRAVSDVEIPLQRELSARRYGQIADIERGYDRELYGQDQALLNRESALQTDYAGREENTARYLNDLRMRVAGMGRAQAQDYLRSLGLPIDMAQRIIAGDIANLSGIQALDERSNYYTVASPYDESRLPIVSTPTLSAPGRSYMGGENVVPRMTIPTQMPSTPSPAVAGNPGERQGDGASPFRPYVPSARTQEMWNANRARIGVGPYGTYGDYYEPTR